MHANSHIPDNCIVIHKNWRLIIITLFFVSKIFLFTSLVYIVKYKKTESDKQELMQQIILLQRKVNKETA